MLRTPPDVLITTPESLYLMLTSQAREFLAEADSVIVDEIHAVARTKRGAHLALTLERLEQVAGKPLQRIGLSATQRPLEEVGRFLVGGGRDCRIVDTGVRKPLDLRIQVPVEDMSEPDAHDVTDAAVGGQGTAAGGGDLIGTGLGDAPATQRSIWPAIYPELLELIRAHRSTIVFVNSRRGAERLAVRLNELAAEDDGPAYIARAHHGSLAREERLVVEDLLKSGELPCLVATSSLELGIDMGAVDLVIQVESPKSVTAGLQRIGRAGHNVGEVSRGRIFPKFRADLLECAVVAKRMRDGEIETTVVPRNPLDVLAQQIVADDRHRRRVEGARAARAGPPRLPVRRADARAARLGARHARRALPVRGVRRAAAAHRLGPGGRHDPRAQGRAPAGGHQRRHDPRPRAVRRAPARRPAGGRARRGDGLRGAPRPDVPARRVDLADRGDHARPRDRHPRPGRPRRRAVLEGRRHRAAQGAGRGDRRVRARGRRPGARRAGGRVRPGRARRAQPVRLPARAARRHPRACRATARS